MNPNFSDDAVDFRAVVASGRQRRGACESGGLSDRMAETASCRVCKYAAVAVRPSHVSWD